MDLRNRLFTRQDTGDAARARRRFARALTAAVVLGPALVLLVLAVVWPAVRITRHHADSPKAGSEAEAGRAKAGAPSGDESLRRLHQDEAYWRARVDLAKNGAINLAVDLIDSTMTLDVYGVPIRECKIRKMRVSRALAFAKGRDDFRDRFSSPLAVRRDTATLPKEPIRVEVAPKDTTEAAEAAMRPLAPEKVDVYFTLVLDGDLALSVRQMEQPITKLAFWRKIGLSVRENTHHLALAVRSLIGGELPEHEPRIEITLSREDAKAIYRALGPKSRIALRL